MQTDTRPGPVAAVRPEPEVVIEVRRDRVTELFRAEYPRLVGLPRILTDADAPEARAPARAGGRASASEPGADGVWGRSPQRRHVVQEAFVRLYASWYRLRDHDRAGAYLRVSVLNVSRGVLRRRRRERNLLLDRPGPAELVATDPTMLSAIRRLPARQRDCVLLRFYLDLSALDIAETLGVSAGTVKNHLHRALQTLALVVEEQP
jgi:RNA polymerase sigma factor (sigma-70 family)